jgi:hypothetical protein
MVQILKHKQRSLLDGQASPPKSVRDNLEKHILFSLKHFDNNQGSTLKEWNNLGHFLDTFDTLKSYSTKTIPEAEQGSFTIYGDFPPAEKTDFTHPKHVPPDARWASLHIKGVPCLAGHVVDNIFFIVILDADHRFWIAEKKNT